MWHSKRENLKTCYSSRQRQRNCNWIPKDYESQNFRSPTAISIPSPTVFASSKFFNTSGTCKPTLQKIYDNCNNNTIIQSAVVSQALRQQVFLWKDFHLRPGTAEIWLRQVREHITECLQLYVSFHYYISFIHTSLISDGSCLKLLCVY